jgi:flagellar M-ring protein FliF
LKPSDIAIVDADSNQSLTQNNLPGGDEAEQQLTRRLISTLSPVVGADGIHATVNVEYETGSSEESQEKYDPSVSAPLNMQRSEETLGPNAAIGGVPGTSSNVPSAKQSAPPAAVTNPAQSTKTESATYGVNRTTRHVIEPAGRIRRLTAAVLVDDAIERKQDKGKWIVTYHKRQPQDLKLISELAQAAIGFDSSRGDVISVQNLTFDHGEAIDLPPTTFVDRARKGLNDYSALVRYAALLVLFVLVYVLMIRPIQRKALSTPTPQPTPPASLPPIGAEAVALPDNAAMLAQRALVLKKQLAEFVQAEPESSTTAVRAWLREETT